MCGGLGEKTGLPRMPFTDGMSLIGLATRLIARTGGADDVVQETFFTAFRKLDKLNDPEALQAWLIRILMSQVKRSLRLRRLRSFFGLDMGKDDDLRGCAAGPNGLFIE